ncbi:hypothetical protein DPMN_055347 [Dreissena polymorpha]|uniref:VWFC domain-containing protein n=1 Tax=Dreissena polymorpha TaxID=45954 RepID=A0A9D4CPU1_DREPO|nr:hypothetical protein DPMN_055347 [Dreissena polymorpha]
MFIQRYIYKQEESCIYDGQEYAHDEVFLDDDCNKCQCDDGNTICEMNAEGCPEGGSIRDYYAIFYYH